MNCWIAGCPGWRRTAWPGWSWAASGRRFAAQLADRAGWAVRRHASQKGYRVLAVPKSGDAGPMPGEC